MLSPASPPCTKKYSTLSDESRSVSVIVASLMPPNASAARKNYPLLFYADHRMRPYTEQIIEDALK